jgi:hypothetical protein
LFWCARETRLSASKKQYSFNYQWLKDESRDGTGIAKSVLLILFLVILGDLDENFI